MVAAFQKGILRQIDHLLDLPFDREKVAHLCSVSCNVVVDIVMIEWKMNLLLIHNLRSERELMRQIPMRIDYRWFLDMDASTFVGS